MGLEPRHGSGDSVEPSPEYATFTSAAYVPTTDGEAAQATAGWLEAQALHPFIREVSGKSLARLALQPGESVLEVGCGTGVFLPGLAALVGRSGRVVGLDHAPAFLAEARNRLAAADLSEAVDLVEGDVHRLPIDDASFDAVHCERVLMHVEDPAAAIGELRRVLRQGGRAVVAEIFAAGATMETPDPDTNRQIERSLVSGIRNGQMGIQLRRLMIKAGFVDVDGEVVGYFETELDQDEADEYARIARELAAQGTLDPGRSEAAIAAVEERRATGTHCGIALMVLVSGRVPRGDRDGD
ncbi:MAG: methyltransferase domain-containing protein [Chloroflexi bacterium]|nr:methyltransferase domain-containing protein [Chloroflexota bacterium]